MVLERDKGYILVFFFFSSRRRHTRFDCDWSSDVCSSDLSWAAVCSARGWGRCMPVWFHAIGSAPPDRKSVGYGKRVDLGGRRIIKTKKHRPARVSGKRTRPPRLLPVRPY